MKLSDEQLSLLQIMYDSNSPVKYDVENHHWSTIDASDLQHTYKGNTIRALQNIGLLIPAAPDKSVLRVSQEAAYFALIAHGVKRPVEKQRH